MSILKGQVKDGWISLTLDGGHVGNSFGLSEATTLSDTLDSKKEVRGIILTSTSNRVFCGGGNLAEYSKLKTKDEGVNINRAISNSLDKLYKTPVPKVALVSGDCFGGGLELISCFDRIVVAPHAYFRFWQLKLSLSFGWGGFDRLCRRMPDAQVKQFYLQISNMSSYEALSTNLIDEICPAEFLEVRAREIISKTKVSRETYKKAHSLSSANERELFEDMWWSEEHRGHLNSNLRTKTR